MNSLNKKYFQIASDISNKLSSLSKNNYIVLIGSVANQNVDKYSDIDIVVFYNQEPSETAIARLFNIPKGKKFWLDDTKFHIHLKIDNIDATTLFVNFKYIEQLIKKAPNLSLDELVVLSKYIADGKLLHGNQQKFQSWKKICKIIPKKIKDGLIYHKMSSLNFWFRQNNLIQLAKRSDWLMVNRTINHSIEWLLTVLYLLNDKIYINPKRGGYILDNFKIKPNEIAQRLENLYLLKNTLRDVKSKINSMVSIMDDIEKLIKKNRNFKK